MTDRSLPRDLAEHARRAAGQPQPDLREQLAAAIRAEWSQLPDGRGPHERLADAVLAVVLPLLDAKQAETDKARATNRRLNLRCQEQESRLAAYVRLVAGWRLGEKGTYVPLRTLTNIAKLAGREVDEDRFELHYQRVEAAEAERDALRTTARTAAGFLRDTAERVEQGRAVNTAALRAAAGAMDDITGGTA